MLFELMIFLPAIIAGGVGILNTVRYTPAKELKALGLAKDYTAVLQEKLVETPSDSVALIRELLRSNEGWQVYTKAYSTAYRHEDTGVLLIRVYHKNANLHTVTANIYSEGNYEKVLTEKFEDKLLVAEVLAFDTRERDRKQAELSRKLAERVLARERGEVQPLLGGPGVNGQPSVRRGDSSERVTAEPVGTLSYDVENNQLVLTGAEGGRRLLADSNFKKRYGFADYDKGLRL